MKPMSHFDISALVNTGSVEAYVQPLYSISKRNICGYEALARGINADGHLIPPQILFDDARKKGLLDELNKLCIKKAIEAYPIISQSHRHCFLSINFETSLIESAQRDLDDLQTWVRQYNILPQSIVIEILESQASSMDVLEAFVAMAREHGFLIALDDFGSGYSNLDRISMIQPEILKLDRSLIHQVHKHFYKQEIVKSLVALSHKFGAQVIAEGVESEDEAIMCLELGADILQGYLFSRPHKPSWNTVFPNMDLIDLVADHYKKHMIDMTADKIARYQSYDTIVSHMIHEFSGLGEDCFERKLQEWSTRHLSIDCLYIINDEGVQVTETVFSDGFITPGRYALYEPARIGADHSNKPYFFFMLMGMKKYVTEPYISLATGKQCVTISVPFSSNNKNYYLCVDIKPDYLK